MKHDFIKISAMIICLLGLSLNTNAQSGRPIWLVGHACNSWQCLHDLIEDGGNGIEIDVHTDEAHKNSDWSVNHGLPWPFNQKYLDKDERNRRNQGRSWQNFYVGLDEYLRFRELPEINFIWIDVKTGEYLSELIDYVNKILYDEYESKGREVPFSILFGVYSTDHINRSIDEKLKIYEGVGLACEGKESGGYATMSIENLKKWLPVSSYHHCSTAGWGVPTWYSYTVESRALRAAKALKDKGEFCIRTGAWTMTKPVHGLQLLCSKADDKWDSYETECDLVLMECRNEFAFGGLLGTHYSVQKFVNWFFRTDGCWYKYNNGHYRLARSRQEDPFYLH